MSNLAQPVESARMSRFTGLAVAFHALLWVVWLLGLFLLLPRVENISRNFNMKLPSMTELMLALTHGVVPLALLIVLVFLAVDGAISLRLRRDESRSGVWMLWSGLMTVAPVFAIIVTAAAICLPSIKLLEGLSK